MFIKVIVRFLHMTHMLGQSSANRAARNTIEIADNAFDLHEGGKANANNGLSSNGVALIKAGELTSDAHQIASSKWGKLGKAIRPTQRNQCLLSRSLEQ